MRRHPICIPLAAVLHVDAGRIGDLALCRSHMRRWFETGSQTQRQALSRSTIKPYGALIQLLADGAESASPEPRWNTRDMT